MTTFSKVAMIPKWRSLPGRPLAGRLLRAQPVPGLQAARAAAVAIRGADRDWYDRRQVERGVVGGRTVGYRVDVLQDREAVDRRARIVELGRIEPVAVDVYHHRPQDVPRRVHDGMIQVAALFYLSRNPDHHVHGAGVGHGPEGRLGVSAGLALPAAAVV